LHLFDQNQPTLVLNAQKNEKEGLIEFIQIDFGDSFLRSLMHLLYKKGINSLLVEGGQTLLASFIKQNYWDEARVFMGNIYFEKGVAAPLINGVVKHSEHLRDNLLTIYVNK